MKGYSAGKSVPANLASSHFKQAINVVVFVTGIYYTMTIIGPAVGYVVGGQLLLLYTDFITVDPSS